MITAGMLVDGIRKGVVKFIDSPNYGAPACKIGDYWFYYARNNGEDESAAQYNERTPWDVLVNEIKSALDEIRDNISEDEYSYYEAVLRENGCIPKKPYKFGIEEISYTSIVVLAESPEKAQRDAEQMISLGEYDLRYANNSGRSVIYQGEADVDDLETLHVYSIDRDLDDATNDSVEIALAIKHLEETLGDPKHEWSCETCREEHMQLRGWLTELLEMRKLFERTGQ